MKTGQPYPIPRTNKLRGQQLTAPFCDDFNSFNTNLWETYKVNANWRSLNSAGTFEPSNLTVENGYLVMKLNQESGDVKSTTTPAVYRSAVFRSVAAMGFGTYDFWMRPASTSKNPAVPGARANGTLADVNLYGETDDTDSNLLPDTLIELRYGYSIPDYLLYTTLRTNQPENSVGVHTGVNMAQGFQHHQWVWTPTSLKMYVGGKLVREETDPSKVPQVAANLAMHLMPTNRPDLGTNLAGNKAPRYTMVDKFCFTPKGAQDFMITPSAPVLGQATTLDASGLAGTDFKWFVGTTQIASGQKTTYTFPTAGSFQVKLTYTNLSGEAKVVTRDVTVSGTNDDAVPIPPDMTYGSPIALEFPVFTADDTAYFDIYRLGDDAYTGKNFRWNFGDGTTATGDAVKHDYKTPGTYTVTLNYEDAKGTTKTFKTQVAAINVAKLVDKGGRSDSLTAKFDAGEEIPGLTYEYTLEDKDNQTATKNGSKVSHTYAGIGTFDYTLTIRDNRAATLGQQSLNRGKMTAQAAEPNRVIFKKTAWHTFWQRAPKAELTWTGSDLAGAPLSTIGVGQSSATVQFSAFYSKDDPRNFQSFDTDLKYEWNFGDGTTSTERDPSHTYTLTKPFLVTLTVTNKYGLKDTKRVWYHIRDFRYDTTLRTEYPNGTITPAATESPKLEAQRVFVISGSPTDIDSEAYLPWVLPNAHNIKRGSHYPIGATGDRTISFCNEYKLYVNGGERYPWYLEQGQTMPDPNILDPIPTMPAAQFCQAMVMVPGNIGALRKSGWNTIEVYSSRGSNRTSVNTFHHLNVPRVMVTVLPDELIPGEQASPVINSYHAFNPDTQVEELIVRVKIRKSEVLDGNIKFKVPVYAVDSTGKRQITVDGAMYARFMNYSESNEPVMFVDGMAEMPVSLNANMFGPDGQEIDLTNIKYLSSKGDCGYGDGPLANAAKQTVAGCSHDKAVYAYPTSNAPVDVPQMPEYFKKRMKLGNHVFYGTTKEEQAEKLREVLDQHKRNTLEAIDTGLK
ncbi:PKD domain-containing protein [Deinococcus fonticola]|uniref:PKD domain-containing protein n=1 Tax=Deinococcus fonticola TaxID=2528713 RepID=UPI00142F901C|nr:PKD domain-containing protein [Deinococcus fonticola]